MKMRKIGYFGASASRSIIDMAYSCFFGIFFVKLSWTPVYFILNPVKKPLSYQFSWKKIRFHRRLNLADAAARNTTKRHMQRHYNCQSNQPRETKTVQHKNTFDSTVCLQRTYKQACHWRRFCLVSIFCSKKLCCSVDKSVLFTKMSKKKVCCLCNTRGKNLVSIFDEQVKVAKSGSISYFDAMKQLTGIEVSGVFFPFKLDS